MNLSFHLLTLLIGQSEPPAPWEGVRGAFQHTLPRADGQASALRSALIFITILLAILMVFCIAVSIYQRGRAEQTRRPPHRFFAHALARLGVGWFDRRWLLHVAKHCELPQPTVMLLTPELFEQHIGQFARSTNPAYRAYIRRRAAAVARITFDEIESEPAPPETAPVAA